MKFWRYKAYDADGNIATGVAKGSEPYKIILEVRQTGLQIYDMVTIQESEYRTMKRADNKIAKMKARLTGPKVQKSKWWLLLIAGVMLLAIVGVTLLILLNL